uniref:EGF-like domain-containing protein n=1 Tax=Biomphalaria glabrata TaxID=6526 RepID=A0A2C9M345_BIOGL
CNKGYHGQNCWDPCPKNCFDNQCDTYSGTCWLCKAGYSGGLCLEDCPIGTYGELCFGKCHEHCRSHKCHLQTGQCNSCEPGYQGLYCEI